MTPPGREGSGEFQMHHCPVILPGRGWASHEHPSALLKQNSPAQPLSFVFASGS